MMLQNFFSLPQIEHTTGKIDTSVSGVWGVSGVTDAISRPLCQLKSHLTGFALKDPAVIPSITIATNWSKLWSL